MVENVTQDEFASVLNNLKDKMGLEGLDDLDVLRALRKECYAALPKAQQKRVRATKFLETQCEAIDKELHQKIFELTESFQPRYNALRAKRAEIIKGTYEPTDEEAPEDEGIQGGPGDTDDEEPAVVEVTEEDGDKKDTTEEHKVVKVTEEDGDNKDDTEEHDGEKGLPSFWLQVFEHADISFEDADEPLLAALVDIRYENISSETFRLVFEFAENEYISNKTLSVTFTPPDEDEDEEVGELVGCDIDWKEGKKLTSKKITKKQRSTKTKKTRTVTQEQPVKSFFGIFELNLKKTDVEVWENVEEHMYPVSDYMIKIRYQIIPDATSFFLDLVSDDEHDEYEDDEYDDEDGDEDEGTEDSDDDIGFLSRFEKQGEQVAGGMAEKGGDAEKPPECQQQ